MSAAETRQPSEQLRDLAQVVRDNPHARDAIANAFDLIADQMEPCFDCGNCQDADPEALDVIHPDDNPETGA